MPNAPSSYSLTEFDREVLYREARPDEKHRFNASEIVRARDIWAEFTDKGPLLTRQADDEGRAGWRKYHGSEEGGVLRRDDEKSEKEEEAGSPKETWTKGAVIHLFQDRGFNVSTSKRANYLLHRLNVTLV